VRAERQRMPPHGVLREFGLAGEAERLAGGLGSSVRVGGAVLKPVCDREEAEWAGGVLDRVWNEVCGTELRIPRPLRADCGRWSVDGWAASEFLAGRTGSAGRWRIVLATSRAFHRAVAGCPRPPFVDRMEHPYALADRYAWGEMDVALVEPVAGMVELLRGWLRPVEMPCQVIHGDLSENLLFAPGQPPAVIDFSPYWRPAAFADGIVIADSLVWSDGDLGLITDAEDPVVLFQMTLRATLFRLVGLQEQLRDQPQEELARQAGCFPRVLALLGEARAGGRLG